jgi:uncharacterized protein (DUF1778 family)
MPPRYSTRSVRFSDSDFEVLERAAAVAGHKSVSAFLRECAMSAAARVLSDEGLRAEHQYQRMVLQGVLEGAALLADFARDQGKDELVRQVKARVKPAVDKLMAGKGMTP